MKKISYLILLLIVSGTVYTQDLIIKKNGEEIKSKVLEVSLTNIRYKKYDNINGPIFEILKSEVFIIKYENGTSDVINPITDKSTQKKVEIGDDETETPSSLAYTDKHKSTTIAYGVSALFGGVFSWGNGERDALSVIGPVVLSFDKALSDRISLAFRPALMYYGFSSRYISSYDRYGNPQYSTANFNYFFGGLQVGIDYHFATSTKVDPYVGIRAGAGYFLGDNFLEVQGINALYGTCLGIRSYGKKKNALLVEIGYDSYSYLKVGYVFGKRK
jgi:hypothetical protein